jgi:hypothetical protein
LFISTVTVGEAGFWATESAGLAMNSGCIEGVRPEHAAREAITRAIRISRVMLQLLVYDFSLLV